MTPTDSSVRVFFYAIILSSLVQRQIFVLFHELVRR